MAVTTRRSNGTAADTTGHSASCCPACMQENAALARAVIRLAIELPGGQATASQIITNQLRLSPGDATAIIAAAQRPG